MTREEHITQAAEPAEEPGTEEVAPEAASSPVPAQDAVASRPPTE